MFNTSSLRVSGMMSTAFGSHTPVHFPMEGAIGITRFGTETAVFTFDQVCPYVLRPMSLRPPPYALRATPYVLRALRSTTNPIAVLITPYPY